MGAHEQGGINSVILRYYIMNRNRHYSTWPVIFPMVHAADKLYVSWRKRRHPVVQAWRRISELLGPCYDGS